MLIDFSMTFFQIKKIPNFQKKLRKTQNIQNRILKQSFNIKSYIILSYMQKIIDKSRQYFEKQYKDKLYLLSQKKKITPVNNQEQKNKQEKNTPKKISHKTSLSQEISPMKIQKIGNSNYFNQTVSKDFINQQKSPVRNISLKITQNENSKNIIKIQRGTSASLFQNNDTKALFKISHSQLQKNTLTQSCKTIYDINSLLYFNIFENLYQNILDLDKNDLQSVIKLIKYQKHDMFQILFEKNRFVKKNIQLYYKTMINQKKVTQNKSSKKQSFQSYFIQKEENLNNFRSRSKKTKFVFTTDYNFEKYIKCIQAEKIQQCNKIKDQIQNQNKKTLKIKQQQTTIQRSPILQK